MRRARILPLAQIADQLRGLAALADPRGDKGTGRPGPARLYQLADSLDLGREAAAASLAAYFLAPLEQIAREADQLAEDLAEHAEPGTRSEDLAAAADRLAAYARQAAEQAQRAAGPPRPPRSAQEGGRP